MQLSLLIKVEPYWNVNNYNETFKAFEGLIKVEPYWNVNLIPDTALPIPSIKLK